MRVVVLPAHFDVDIDATTLLPASTNAKNGMMQTSVSRPRFIDCWCVPLDVTVEDWLEVGLDLGVFEICRSSCLCVALDGAQLIYGESRPIAVDQRRMSGAESDAVVVVRTLLGGHAGVVARPPLSGSTDVGGLTCGDGGSTATERASGRSIALRTVVVDAPCEVMTSGLGKFVPRSSWHWCGAPGRTRTFDPRLRRPVLYPTELRARGENLSAIVDEDRSRSPLLDERAAPQLVVGLL